MYRTIMFFLILFLTPTFLMGQRVYDTLWTRTYGGSELDKGHAIELTYDGGYVIAGETQSFGTDPLAIYLIKADSNGNFVWSQTFGGSLYDYALSVRETADSGFIIAGVTNSFGAGYRDMYLIKTNETGDTIWTKTYGGSGNDVGATALQTQDGGYIVLGTTYSFGAGSGDVWLVKTDTGGNALWTRSYGGVDSEAGWDLQPTTDGGYIITGQTRSFGAGDFDVYLIKTDAIGDTLWTRTYGGAGDDRGFSVCEYWGGDYLVAGYTASFGAGGDDMYLIRTDSSGGALMTETYGGALDERANSIREGHFAHILLGYTASYGAGGTDLYVLEINPVNGIVHWYGVYGGIAEEEGAAMRLMSSSGPEAYFVVAGYTASFGAGIEDVWLLKFRWMDGISETTMKPIPQNIHMPTIFSGPIHLPDDTECMLYDVTGRKISTPEPAPGIYFVEIEGVSMQKIVKVQ